MSEKIKLKHFLKIQNRPNGMSAARAITMLIRWSFVILIETQQVLKKIHRQDSRLTDAVPVVSFLFTKFKKSSQRLRIQATPCHICGHESLTLLLQAFTKD